MYNKSVSKNGAFSVYFYKAQCETTVLSIIENIFNSLDSIFPFIKVLGAKIELKNLVKKNQLRGGNKYNRFLKKIPIVLGNQKRILSSLFLLMPPHTFKKEEFNKFIKDESDFYIQQVNIEAFEKVKSIECNITQQIKFYQEQNINEVAKNSIFKKDLIKNYFITFCLPIINNLLIDFANEVFYTLIEHFPNLIDFFMSCKTEWAKAVTSAKHNC